ncbi:MAG: T9SS type A sorting domain-containing protein, partial [Bacteroidota bacterium]
IGVNSVFGSVSGDPYTERAEANLLLTGKDPADYLGYYQIQDPATGYEPWGWYDPNDPNIAQSTDPDSANFIPGATGSGSRANPFATKEKALAHIDTVMGFFVPRAMVALGLNMEDSIGTSIDQNLRIDAGLDIFPNPTANTLTIRVGNSAMPIRGMQLIDMSGRVVASLTATRAYEYTLERNRLVDGVYVLKVDFDAGSVTERVLFAGN